MNGPQQVLIKEATELLRAAGSELRKRGWPVELNVDYVVERDTYAVSLRFELPPMPTPIESESASARRPCGPGAT